MRTLLLMCALCACSIGQQADEETALQQALAEAGGSPVDFMRALEQHLAKYPKTPRRAELERALARAAMEANDQRRLIEFGERVLARESDDFKLLERVAHALLSTPDRERAARALGYARKYEETIRTVGKSRPDRIGAAGWQEQVDAGIARGQVLQALALGHLGKTEESIALARKSYESFPTAEAARQLGLMLVRAGRDAEALQAFADAFTVPDTRAGDRGRDRARLGEIYRKLHGSEKGLGDVVLEAYDRNTARANERRLRLKQLDPNAAATSPMEFTITGLQGDKLALASLKGKVVVMDFWATWCGPCRAQHPLYQQVMQRFKDRDDVVFLSINTDDTRELVAEFVEANKWDRRVYFEDGLAAALKISSIPTALLINKRGEIASRMNGFIPDRFVDMLSDRIRQALGE